MEDNNQSISEFIKKLKTIDIGELLEKAQTIKIEDIRSVKWKDIYRSKLFFPFMGLILAVSSSIWIFLPAYRKTNSIRIESKLYRNETIQLDSLKKNLDKSLLILKKIKEKSKELNSFVINKNNLIKIPRLLNDAAELAKINLIEIRPISKDSASCFSSDKERENSINTQRNLRRNNPSNSQNIFPELEIQPKTKDKQFMPIDYNQFKPSNKRLRNIFSIPVNEIDTNFTSNFYLLTLEATYLNSMKFIRNLQDYKVSIIPICFEPKGLLSNQNSQRNSFMSENKNKLNIRIIINVPTE
tara:strand:+ start:459 stop:1355 length:897 start_codon:yes stop_codon:yes gene_type:complete